MSNSLAGLYRLQKSDIQKAAGALTDAFQHDPVWNAVFDGASMAQREYAFETPIRNCLKYGEIYAPSEALEGVAAWLPGSISDLSILRILGSGAIWPAIKTGVRLARKMQPIFSPVEKDRKDNMKGKPYIYLQIIGVVTYFQGQGLGGKLLRALIEKSEQNGVPIYLETETEANVSLYEYFGFSVIKMIMLPIINLPMWEMIRLNM